MGTEDSGDDAMLEAAVLSAALRAASEILVRNSPRPPSPVHVNLPRLLIPLGRLSILEGDIFALTRSVGDRLEEKDRRVAAIQNYLIRRIVNLETIIKAIQEKDVPSVRSIALSRSVETSQRESIARITELAASNTELKSLLGERVREAAALSTRVTNLETALGAAIDKGRADAGTQITRVQEELSTSLSELDGAVRGSFDAKLSEYKSEITRRSTERASQRAGFGEKVNGLRKYGGIAATVLVVALGAIGFYLFWVR